MAENPLLPDAELRRLYHLLKQASRPAARKGTPSAAGPLANTEMAALAVSCTMQLGQNDVLVMPAALASAAGLQGAGHEQPHTVSTTPAGVSNLLAAAAVASAQQARAGQGAVLAMGESNQPDPAWKVAFQWAQEQKLPLITAIVDRSGPESMQRTPSSSAAPGWTALDRLCRQLQLPILTVDGSDAVASYRVMQESALRARAGGGPAILWAVLPPSSHATGTEGASDSLANLSRYMKVRRIALR